MNHGHLSCHMPRRTFLADMGMGFTGLALGAMLQNEARANDVAWAPPDGLERWRQPCGEL